jgi:hypothetical protein
MMDTWSSFETRFLQEPHGVISQKTPSFWLCLFISVSAATSISTQFVVYDWQARLVLASKAMYVPGTGTVHRSHLPVTEASALKLQVRSVQDGTVGRGNRRGTFDLRAEPSCILSVQQARDWLDPPLPDGGGDKLWAFVLGVALKGNAVSPVTKEAALPIIALLQ